jgi:hypothetical protein
MRICLGLFAAIATIIIAGSGTTMLLTRQRLTIWENFALAWLFGTAIVSLSLWISGFVLRGSALQIEVTAICFVIGALGFFRRQKVRSESKDRPIDKAEIFFIALFLIELILMFCLSFQRTLGWDGLLVWEIKARYAFLNGGALPNTFFTDTSRAFANPQYPLLLPLTETWLYLWIGDCNQFWVKFIFPIWYAAAMSMLLVAAADLSESRLVGWVIVLLFPLIPCVHDRPGGFQVGYADAPLSAIYLAAVFYLLRFIRDGSRDAMVLFIALGATLVWMKPEGLMLWAALALCGAVVIQRTKKRWTLAALSFLPGLSLIAFWILFLISVHVQPSHDFVFPTFGVVYRNIDRTAGILSELYFELTRWSDWDIFWLLAAIAMIVLIARVRNMPAAALLWLLVIPILCLCGCYFFSALDYIWHIHTSLRRHLIQVVPIAWLLIAFAFAPSRRAVTKHV